MTIETQVLADDTNPGGVQANAEVKTEGEGTVKTEVKIDDPNKADPTKVEEVKYEFKMPDGVEPDAKAIEDFTKVAKELKLSPEQAQQLVDLRSAAVKANIDKHAATVKGWAEEVKADKELGGDKLAENLAIAKKAIDLGPPELKELLDDSGLGNHPAMFKWAYAIGKALSEDTFRAGGKAPVTEQSTASVLYGGTPKT